MWRLVAKRWLLALTGFLLALGLTTLLLCWRYGIWNRTDFRTYQEVIKYPFGLELWFGDIVVGQDVARLTTQHRPHRTLQLGPFLCITYYTNWSPDSPPAIHFESLTIIAKDGKLVRASAGGCTWGRVFFDMSEEEQEQYEQAWKARFDR